MAADQNLTRSRLFNKLAHDIDTFADAITTVSADRFLVYDASVGKFGYVTHGDLTLTDLGAILADVVVGVDGTGHDVTFFGDTAGKSWLWDQSADKMIVTGASDFLGAIEVGVNDAGHDVNFYGATAGQKLFWDESADTLNLDATVQIDGTVTVGVSDTGYDVQFFGDTAAKSWLWDTSADKMIVTGSSTFTGDTQHDGTFTVGVDNTGYDVTFFGATSGQKFLWDESADTAFLTCTVDVDGTVTVGVDGTGYDVKFFGDTAGKSMLWDQSADSLIVTGTADIIDGLLLNSVAVDATAAEINKLDDSAVALTAGTGIASAESYGAGTFLNGSIYVTRLIVDLTGLVGAATDLDIIGDTGGAANANFGQITAAKSGTIVGGQVTCLETPAGGADDIDLYSATVATGAQDDLITDLTEVALLTRGDAWAAGDVKPMTGVPTANDYLYVVCGEAVGGTYTAGKFLIEFFGT